MTKTESVRLLFHVHSRASFDGIMSARSIVRFCSRRGIRLLAICDHDSSEALEKALREAARRNIHLIPAVEHRTDAGDIIGLFSTRQTRSKRCCDVIGTIKSSGGLAVLPHPMTGHCLELVPLRDIDIIEVFNSRCSDVQNEGARRLAEELGKPCLVSSDAHFPWELGLAVNIFDSIPGALRYSQEKLSHLLLHAPRRFEVKTTSALSVHLSQLVKGCRIGRAAVIFSNLTALCKGTAAATVKKIL